LRDKPGNAGSREREFDEFGPGGQLLLGPVKPEFECLLGILDRFFFGVAR
jgi:hypothetical protein